MSGDIIVREMLDPFFPKDLSSQFDKLWRRAALDGPLFSESVGFPKCNAWVDEKDEVLRIDITAPYLKREDISIETDSRLRKLTVEATSHQSEDDRKYLLREIPRTSFKRSFVSVDEDFDLTNVRAKIEDGILRLEIPKSREAVDRFKKVKVE